MASIKLKLEYHSQNSNGWPLIMIKVNDVIIDRFEANSTTWEKEFMLDLQDRNDLKIEHYGKNYLLDNNPDKYFELHKIYFNEVDLKYHIHQFKQLAYLPPWDTVGPPEHSLYLGHNGVLLLNFSSPIDSWIQGLFNINDKTMDGQQTTKAVLQHIKAYFNV